MDSDLPNMAKRKSVKFGAKRTKTMGGQEEAKNS